MKQGWISVHRQLQDHWLWEDKPFSKGQAWIDILMLANHADNKFLLGNELVEVKAGSFITSELKLMERWGWSKTKVRAFLKLLQNDSMIVKKSDRKKTTIIVENYRVFQDIETTDRPQADYEQTTDRPQADTNNNDNNDNNENNDNKNRAKRFTPPSLDEVKAYCLARNNTVDPEAFIDFYESKGWMVGKNKMKDWKAAVRTWEKGRLKPQPQNQNNAAGRLDESYDMMKEWSES